MSLTDMTHKQMTKTNFGLILQNSILSESSYLKEATQLRRLEIHFGYGLSGD